MLNGPRHEEGIQRSSLFPIGTAGKGANRKKRPGQSSEGTLTQPYAAPPDLPGESKGSSLVMLSRELSGDKPLSVNERVPGDPVTLPE